MKNGYNPSTVLDEFDPGDDTLARYKYQCSTAAINCIRLLTDQSGVVCVVCENFEDILIEKSNGQYIGLQVKTKRLDLDSFKATDDVILKSFARFCKLDQQFQDQFEAFDFSTNHQFWQSSENEKNLPWLIESIKVRKTVKRLPKTNPIRKFVQNLATRTELAEGRVVATLCKTVLNSRLEPVDAIDHRVREAVGSYSGTSELNLAQCAKLAEELVNMTFQASSKKPSGETTDLYAAGVDFSDVVKVHLMAGKCIDKAMVQSILSTRKVTSEPLELSSLVPIHSLPTHLAVMIQKLDKGGLQAARIDEMSDLVQSFQALLFRWVSKFGTEGAEERYQTLMLTVKFECTEAQVASEKSGSKYAPKMYDLLLDRLRARVLDAHDELHGSRAEHLIGAAGMLTQQCKAWWSPKFEVAKAP